MKALLFTLCLLASQAQAVVAAYSPGSVTVYSSTSPTATVVNLTVNAGVATKCVVCLSSNGGAAAGFKVQFGTSAAAPVNLTSTGVGHYIAASASAQCWGPFMPGVKAYIAGVAATSSVIVDVMTVKE